MSAADLHNRARHGVLVTFHRETVLADHLDRLARQTLGLRTLVVVDNGRSEEARRLVTGAAGRAARHVHYLDPGANIGPAGGFRAGVVWLGDAIGDDDVVILLDDDDPPWRDDSLEMLGTVFDELAAAHADFGGVGTWGASLRRAGRLVASREGDPARVDYLSGDGCPHYGGAAAKAVGGPDADLFFGFEELDFGLALQRAGYSIWSSGLSAELGLGRSEYSPPSWRVTEPNWRRYYSLRNLIVVLRKDHRTIDAVALSLVAGFAKPLANLPRHPVLAARNLRLNARACRDGWVRRLGMRLDPADLPVR